MLSYFVYAAYVARPPGGFELQAKLFLHCGENIRPVRIGRGRQRAASPPELSAVGPPREIEIEIPGEARLINDGPIEHQLLQATRKHRDGGVAARQVRAAKEQAGRGAAVSFGPGLHFMPAFCDG